VFAPNPERHPASRELCASSSSSRSKLLIKSLYTAAVSASSRWRLASASAFCLSKADCLVGFWSFAWTSGKSSRSFADDMMAATHLTASKECLDHRRMMEFSNGRCMFRQYASRLHAERSTLGTWLWDQEALKVTLGAQTCTCIRPHCRPDISTTSLGAYGGVIPSRR
jgi:hypothetical protein